MTLSTTSCKTEMIKSHHISITADDDANLNAFGISIIVNQKNNDESVFNNIDSLVDWLKNSDCLDKNLASTFTVSGEYCRGYKTNTSHYVTYLSFSADKKITIGTETEKIDFTKISMFSDTLNNHLQGYDHRIMFTNQPHNVGFLKASIKENLDGDPIENFSSRESVLKWLNDNGHTSSDTHYEIISGHTSTYDIQYIYADSTNIWADPGQHTFADPNDDDRIVINDFKFPIYS